MFAIVCAFLLHGVVGQMDHFILDIIEGIFCGGCADVTVLVPVALQDPVGGGDEEVAPDVKLAVVYSKWEERYRKHFYRYFCTITVRRSAVLPLSRLLTSLSSSDLQATTLIPLPRLLFSPGFTIQMFFCSESDCEISSNFLKS